jgi:hypothetical protein
MLATNKGQAGRDVAGGGEAAEVTLRTGAELDAVMLAEAAAFPPDLLARIPRLIGR